MCIYIYIHIYIYIYHHIYIHHPRVVNMILNLCFIPSLYVMYIYIHIIFVNYLGVLFLVSPTTHRCFGCLGFETQQLGEFLWENHGKTMGKWFRCPFLRGFVKHITLTVICWRFFHIPFLVGWCETLGIGFTKTAISVVDEISPIWRYDWKILKTLLTSENNLDAPWGK